MENLPFGALRFTLYYHYTTLHNLLRKITLGVTFKDLSEMGKSKPTQPAKVSNSKKGAEVKAISSVKEGAITKPSQTPKSKSKEIAKHVAAKTELVEKAAKGDKKSKKAKKEPTPEPSSSEAESDEEMASASSASSSDESDSESESESESAESEVDVPKKDSKANGAKVGEKPNPSANVAVESSSSSSSSDAEDEDDSEDQEDEQKPAAPKSASSASKLAHTAKVGHPKDESDSDAESGSSDVDSEEESGDDEDDSGDSSEDDTDNEGGGKPKVKGPVDAKALNGALAKVASEQVVINPSSYRRVLSCLLEILPRHLRPKLLIAKGPPKPHQIRRIGLLRMSPRRMKLLKMRFQRWQYRLQNAKLTPKLYLP